MSMQHEVPPESPYASMSAEQVRTWYAYMKLQLRLRYEMNRQLRADSDISLADYDVLVALTSEPGGEMTMSALATRIGWERSRASHHAKRMAERGFLELRRAEHDRRTTAVALSDAGWRTLREATPSHTELVKDMFFSDLREDELAGFADVLERVYESVLEHGTLPRPADHP
ncbi:MarR family transcriptional regulator [Curtobacterium sp. MCSS17_011]|uniref:MarR family winged helix-turn-helix transcriptional regulator n=1 Tax=Curtobacterium sp. MCSS17_011 TaxID=2175643 RepID=UPI000D88BD2A|nr:MarR family winged helix-turn-helix transcriptional regulator [Curtobacterium sp. MCSS17_011]PYY57878.1 MarR family transcriptional regulator [Curtobacterium sp. MCSS17_011]